MPIAYVQAAVEASGGVLPRSPDLVATGEVLATLNDWRAILIVALFLILSLFGVVVWLLLILRAQTKSIDRLARAMFAFRIAIADRGNEPIDIEAIERDITG